MTTFVKHVSSKETWQYPKDGSESWLEYWYNNSKYSYPSYCPDCGQRVYKSDLVGAHVMKENSFDKKIYIIPVCRQCNTKGASDNHSFACDSEYLVPANKENLY